LKNRDRLYVSLLTLVVILLCYQVVEAWWNGALSTGTPEVFEKLSITNTSVTVYPNNCTLSLIAHNEKPKDTFIGGVMVNNSYLWDFWKSVSVAANGTAVQDPLGTLDVRVPHPGGSVELTLVFPNIDGRNAFSIGSTERIVVVTEGGYSFPIDVTALSP